MLSGARMHVCHLSGVEMLSGRLISSNCVYGALRQRLADKGKEKKNSGGLYI